KPTSSGIVNTIEAGAASALYTAIQRPIDGGRQLVNHLAGSEVLGQPKLFAQPLETEFGTAEWTAQQIGSGAGYAADVALLLGLSRLRPFRAAGNYASKTLDKPVLRALNTTGARAFAAGFALEGIGQPIHQDEMENFWNARLRNGLNGGV